MADQTVTLRVQVDAGGAVEALRQVTDETTRLGDEAEISGTRASRAFDDATAAIELLRAPLAFARDQLLGLVGVSNAATAIDAIASLSDEYAKLQRRISQVADSQAQASAASLQATSTTQQMLEGLSAASELYGMLASNSVEASLSLAQFASGTSTIGQSLLESAASADAANESIRHFKEQILSDLGKQLVNQLRTSAAAWAASRLEVIGLNASLLKLGATSPIVARALNVVGVAATRLSALMGPISLILTAVAIGATLFAKSSDKVADSAQSEIDKLRASNDELERKARLQRLVDSGRATESSAGAVDELNRLTSAVTDLESEFARAEQVAVKSMGSIGPLLRVLSVESDLKEARRALADYGTEVARQAVLTRDMSSLPPLWRDIAESIRGAAIKAAEFLGIEELVAKLQPPKLTSTDAEKSLENQIADLKAQQLALTDGAAAALAFALAHKLGGKSAADLDDKLIGLTKTVADETDKLEKLREEKRKEIDEREISTQAVERFRVETERLRAELDGPTAQVHQRFIESVRQMGAQLESGAISEQDAAERVKLLIAVRDRAAQSIENQRTPFQQMIDGLQFEGSLIGLTNEQREIAVALRQVEQQTMEEGNRVSDEEIERRKEEVKSLLEKNQAQGKIAEQAKQAAEEYKNAWKGATDKVTNAFGEFVARGAKGFKDFSKQLNGIAKSLIAELVAMFLRNTLVLRVSGVAGGIFGAGKASAGTGGAGVPDVGSSFMSPGLIAALGTFSGVLSGLKGGSGGASTIGSAIAGGALGFAGSTIALGASLGASGALAGGASAAAGALSGAAGAAAALPPFAIGLAVAAIVDKITGGALFGTKFATTSAGRDIAVGDEGASGFNFVNQKRKKALFGGTKRRTLQNDLDQDTQDAIDAIFQSVRDVVAAAAIALRTDVPTLVSGSFRQEFDKKGNLKKEFSTIAGRVYNEGQEAFTKRLQAENVLATIDAALGPVAQQVTEAVAQPILEGIDDFSNEFGGRTGDVVRRGLQPGLTVVAQAQGEASQIAERWRGNAEKLLAGAQFLLAASVDMRNGFTLLGEGGTLTSVTELIEDLNKAGESLSDTYARVVGGTKLLEEALALQNQSLELGREQFVRFATDIANAAGGLERATTLWQDYFARFFNDNERATQLLSRVQTAAQEQFGDIDLTASDFAGDGGLAQFRALFQEALPSLSADAVVQWLEAAQALGQVIDAQAALNQTLGDTAQAADTSAQAMAGQHKSLLDNVHSQASSAEEALANFGLSELAIGLQQVTRDVDKAIAEATHLGATEAELAEIRALGAARTELLQRKAQADLANLLDGVSQSLFELDASPLEIELARVQSAMDATLAQASALGATEEQLAQIREFGARQVDRATAAAEEQAQAEVAQRAQQLSEMLDGVTQSLFELDASPLEVELVRIQRATREMVTQATDLGASEEQLAQIRALGARQSANVIEAEAGRIREAFAQLAQSIGQTRQSIAGDILGIRRTQPGFSESGFQTGRLSDLRAQLDGAQDPQQRIEIIDKVREATLARYNAELASIQQTEQAQQQAAQSQQQAVEAQRQALERLRGFVDTLGLSATSPLTAFQRLDVAQSVFDQTLARARGGDLEAIGGLQEAANALLTENRNVFGVSDQAVRTFDQVRSALSGVAEQGVRGAAAISDPFQRASLDTSARIAQLQESAIAELQGLDDALAMLELTQQAESEGSIDALHERFDQAERHNNELIENILPFLDVLNASAATDADQLTELRAQTQALAELVATFEGQQGNSGALLDKFLVFMQTLQEQGAQQQAEIERMARAVEATARTGVRA